MSPEMRLRISAQNDTARGFAEVKRDAATAAAAVEASGRRAAGGMNMLAGSSRLAASQTRNLVFQLNDVGVSLASGMNPLMVFAQQGSQIATIYGPEEGGIGRAFQETGKLALSMVTKFWPIAAVVGAGAAAFAGLTYEINKTAETQVSFGDVFVASMQLVAESIGAMVAPAISQIGTWTAQMWDYAWPIWKDNINGIIGAMVGAYEATKQAWSNLPTFFGAVGKEAWNNLVSEFEKPALTWNDQVIIPGFDLSGMKAQLSEAEKAAMGAANVTFNASQRDFVGEGMGALSGRSQELALARIAEEAEKTGKAIKGASDKSKELGDTLAAAARAAKEEWDFYRGAFNGFLTDMKSGLQSGKSLWESFGSSALTALDKITNRAFDMAANGIFDMLFGTFMGGLGGGFSPQLGKGMTGASVFGGSGGSYGIPGFATGGSFTVGGSGGPDSQMRALRLTPGERVSIRRPGQGGGDHSRVLIELGPGLEGKILQQAAGQSMQIVQAAAPTIVESGAAASGGALARGDYDRGMANYGLARQAKVR